MLARRISCVFVLAGLVISVSGLGCAVRHAQPANPSARANGTELSDDATANTAKPAETDCASTSAAGAPAGSANSGTNSDENEEHATLDDGFEPPAAAGGGSGPLPFADLSDAELTSRLRANIGALGPMSIGHAHGGVLISGVQMPTGANWELVSPGLSWGTKETVESLGHAIDAVAARFPETPKAFIGNISAKQGGHLPPHVSHQSGRDVDLGYYLTEGHRWYAPANAKNLDRPRTWHLVRTLLADSDIDLVLIDTEVQKILKAYAREIGEDQAWLDQIFQVGGKSTRPVIFHAKGHATHLHIRFYSPAAQELGRRGYKVLLAKHLIAPPTLYITHTTKQGETLSHLAHRYKVTPEAIKKANGMKSDVLGVKKPYKIPQVGGIPMPERVAMPARRTPPSPTTVATTSGSKKGWDGEPCHRTGTPDTARSGS